MDGFERNLELIEQIAEYGKGKKGISRLAMTESDRRARKVVIAEMKSLGMSVKEDACCNIHALLPAETEVDNSRAPVAMGSHLDSVPEGGRYDGVLGVTSALGVVRDIVASGQKRKRPLSVIVFNSEESSRFSLACIGSKALTGNLSLSDTFRFKDKNGKLLLNAIREFGGVPERINNDCISPVSYHSYFELHIEQGPVLDRTGDNVGLVGAIAAPTRFALVLKGEQAHSGACPMNMRHDALTAAASIILAVEACGKIESEFGSVATVGVCDCIPGAMNVVPGEVILKVDLRGIVGKSISRMYRSITERIASTCQERGIEYEIIPYSSDNPVTMDGALLKRLERICKKKKISYRCMPSGAGHDAMYMASLIPSALIFVPCKNGISHNPLEDVDPVRIRPGYEVLKAAVSELIVEN